MQNFATELKAVYIKTNTIIRALIQRFIIFLREVYYKLRLTKESDKINNYSAMRIAEVNSVLRVSSFFSFQFARVLHPSANVINIKN